MAGAGASEREEQRGQRRQAAHQSITPLQRRIHNRARAEYRSIGVMATLKDLKLKTGVCKRTLKEFRSYESEEKREAAKTQSMRDNNADPYDIKQQVLESLCTLVVLLFPLRLCERVCCEFVT